MEEYVKPQVEIQQFTICDVITTSGGNNREPIETPDLQKIIKNHKRATLSGNT